MTPRLLAILEFLQVCDQFKMITRQSWLTHELRRESDAEHSWHMALFALALAGELDVDVDIAKVLALVTVHDLVEIYAGDSYAFDYEGADQSAREEAAAQRLFALLPEDLELKFKGWWLEFEAATSPEAQFARSLDRLQAFTQSILSTGRDWADHSVERSKTDRRMAPARAFDPAITALVDHQYSIADARGLWYDPSTVDSQP